MPTRIFCPFGNEICQKKISAQSILVFQSQIKRGQRDFFARQGMKYARKNFSTKYFGFLKPIQKRPERFFCPQSIMDFKIRFKKIPTRFLGLIEKPIRFFNFGNSEPELGNSREIPSLLAYNVGNSGHDLGKLATPKLSIFVLYPSCPVAAFVMWGTVATLGCPAVWLIMWGIVATLGNWQLRRVPFSSFTTNACHPYILFFFRCHVTSWIFEMGNWQIFSIPVLLFFRQALLKKNLFFCRSQLVT